MKIKKMVDLKMKKFLNLKYNAETFTISEYNSYISTVIDFSGNKKQILKIIELYEKQLKQYILSNSFIKEDILYDGQALRHDLDFEEEVNLEKVFASMKQKCQLTYFEQRARDIIIFEVMNLFNIYGIDILLNNPKLVKKEMDYGIFYLKARKEEADFDKMMFLGDKYGKDAIKYIQNLELLRSRVLSLFEVIPDELLPLLKKLYKKIDSFYVAVNDQNSTVMIDVHTLKKLYNIYEKINKSTIRYLMRGKIPYNISEPIEPLLMLHFIQDSDALSNDNLGLDKEMNIFMYNEILETAKRIIKLKNGRDYDELRDRKQLEEILMQYLQTRSNPFDFKSRIPLRREYISNNLRRVITKPNTLLSVSISKIENLSVHMGRRIAIGFIPKDVGVDAIKMTCSFYNSENDVYDFDRGSHSIVEIMDKNKSNLNANETLIDWTKVKPGYIFVIKTGEELEPEIILRVEELKRKNKLPVIIFDQYSLKNNKRKH